MRCPRTREIDWVAYQADPTAEEWAEVRAHFPTCPDCTREVERLTQMRLALAEAEPPAHPGEEELLAYDREPVALTAMRHSEIERHVSGCQRCQNELSVLEAMMPVRATANATANPARAEGEGLMARLVGFLTGGPALATVAALALMAIGLFIALDRTDTTGTVDPEQLAVEEPRSEPGETQPPSEDTLPGLEPDARPSDVERLAERPAVPEAPAETQRVQESLDASPGTPSGPEQLAEAPSAPERVAPEPDEPDERPTEMLIASLDLPFAAPSYDPTALLSGAGLGASRIDVMIRSGGAVDNTIRVLAPVHTAITFERSPRLFFYLSAASDVAIEILIVERETDEPIFEQMLAPPVREGLHAVDLVAAGVELEPARDYLFFASIVSDPERRDLDLTTGVVLRARPDAAPAPGPLAERPEALARAGSWIDAFAMLEHWIEAAPELPRAVAHRDALLRQVGREDIARALALESGR